jgi:hypothetical protein
VLVPRRATRRPETMLQVRVDGSLMLLLLWQLVVLVLLKLLL